MNSISFTPLDSLLSFTHLHLLVFSPQWNLMSIHPLLKNFLGWDESEVRSYDFNKHFLQVNELDLQRFLGQFQYKDYVVKNYYWQTIDQNREGPFETYFRLKRQGKAIKSLMAFIKIRGNENKIQIDPEMKFKLYLSELLPGLLHNFNGPFGTMTGRIELLKQKYPQIEEINELLNMSNKMKIAVENICYKISHERSSQESEINLNRLLKEEIGFLNSDLFFKHQVEKNIKYENNIPSFKMHYVALSGIISETYYFFRHFFSEDSTHTLQAGTFKEKANIGFYLKFLGNFSVPAHLSVRFPFTLEGDSIQVAQQKINGLDSRFLTFCLQKSSGYLELQGRKEMLIMRLYLPLPKQ